MFGMNLREIRRKKNFTQGSLATALSEFLGEEIGKVNVAKWETGTNPKISIIVALSEVLEIPEQYLFDDSDRKINRILAEHNPNAKEVITQTKKVILIDGYVGAGSSGVLENLNIKNHIYIDQYSINKKYQDENIKAIEVIGDSMSPYIEDSDIVLFKSLKDCFSSFHDGKYIIETANGLQVKNLSFKANGNIVISSENSSYPPEEIKKNESQEVLEIRGIVVGRILKN